jgi:N-acetylglucosaminyl-diphospho-decaprenol L-rhamnosyltransferase
MGLRVCISGPRLIASFQQGPRGWDRQPRNARSQRRNEDSGAMDLSICILTHNQPTLLPECVEACLSEIASSRVAAEIIVVDNASSDAYPTKLAGLSPLIRIICNEKNLSFSVANNIAIRSGNGRYVLILNDDAVLQEGSLSLMLRKMDSNPRIGAVGPKLLNPDGSLQEHFTNRRFPHVRGIMLSFLGIERRLATSPFWRDLLTLDQEPQHSGETDHVAGACLLARRAALEDVNLFDEKFHYWFEDTDLCYRLKRVGWMIIYLAEAPVVHYGSASLNKINDSERTTMFLRSLMLFYSKNERPWKRLLLRFSLMLTLACRACRIALRNLTVDASKRKDCKSRLRACFGLMRLVSGKA